MCSASKMEINNVEASHQQQATELPTVKGRLMPWTRDRSILLEGIAKFRAAESDSLTRWIPGQQFKAKLKRLVYTVEVVRFLEPKVVAGDRVPVYRGRGKWNTELVKARTIPEAVVVRIIAVEPGR